MSDVRPKLSQYELELILRGLEKAGYNNLDMKSPEYTIYRRIEGLTRGEKFHRREQYKPTEKKYPRIQAEFKKKEPAK